MEVVEQDLREKILRTAERLFFNYGYTTVTVDELSRSASVSKRSVYKYFSTKEELLHYTLVGFYERRHAKALEFQFDDHLDFYDFSIRTIEYLLHAVKSEPNLLFTDLELNASTLYEACRSARSNVIALSVGELLRRASQGGHLRPSIEPRHVVQMLLNCFDSALSYSIWSKDLVAPVDLYRQSICVIVNGMLSEQDGKELSKRMNAPGAPALW